MARRCIQITPQTTAITFTIITFLVSIVLFGLNCAVAANSAERDGSGNGPLSFWNVISMLVLSLISAAGFLAFQTLRPPLIRLYIRVLASHWILDALGTSAFILASILPLRGAGFSKVTCIVIVVFVFYKIIFLGLAYLVWRSTSRLQRDVHLDAEDDIEGLGKKSNKVPSIPIQMGRTSSRTITPIPDEGDRDSSVDSTSTADSHASESALLGGKK